MVGYGTAGSAAAGYARRTCRKCRVTVIERRRYAVFHPCSIPGAIAGRVPFASLMEEHPLTAGVEALLGRRVVDAGEGFVELDEGGRIEYDELVLATGARPLIPGSLREALSLDGVYTIRDVEDGVRVRSKALSSSRAVVVGGGAIGLEVAVALRELGLRVTVFEMMPHVLPGMLDEDMARIAESFLREKGVEVLTESPVNLIEARSSGLRVMGGGLERAADLVVLAIGVRPETSLAQRIGAEIGRLGGIVVDEHMETTVKGVYAAGDNVEIKNLVTGRETLAMLASPAFRQGRVAGINAAGGKARYRGTVKPWIVDLHEASIGGVGLSLDAAKQAGISATSSRIQAYDKPSYMPSAKKITVKLVADRENGRILGVQAFGETSLTNIIDVASALVGLGADVWSILELENAYMPSYSEVYTPLYVAAEAVSRRIRRQ